MGNEDEEDIPPTAFRVPFPNQQFHVFGLRNPTTMHAGTYGARFLQVTQVL